MAGRRSTPSSSDPGTQSRPAPARRPSAGVAAAGAAQCGQTGALSPRNPPHPEHIRNGSTDNDCRLRAGGGGNHELQLALRRLELTPSTPLHPAYVVWELTLACDQPCTHCGSRAGQARATELSTDAALNVVGQLAAAGAREVVLIGGEAYLHPGFLDIVAGAGAGRHPPDADHRRARRHARAGRAHEGGGPARRVRQRRRARADARPRCAPLAAASRLRPRR